MLKLTVYLMTFIHLYLLGDALLSRHTGIDIKQLNLSNQLAVTHSGEVNLVCSSLFV
jgi:hypothetical protein